MEKGCARAHVLAYTLADKYNMQVSMVSFGILNMSVIGPADPEI